MCVWSRTTIALMLGELMQHHGWPGTSRINLPHSICSSSAFTCLFQRAARCSVSSFCLKRAAGETVFLSFTPLPKVFSFLGWLSPFM